MSGLILGVDGGQTSTVAILAARSGKILGIGYGGPANHIHEAGGMERMQRSLRDAVLGAFEQAGISSIAVESACFGMTGGAELVKEVAPKFISVNILSAYHDVVTALAGASLASPGIVVIAGTGAIVYGRDEEGHEAKADGWGYLMGDEGSAYDIGLQVLRAAAQAKDKRGADTLLQTVVPRFWHKADLAGVRAALYTEQMTRADIAGLAWVAFCAAESGDKVAQDILANAGQQLAKAAYSVIEALDITRQNPMVYLTGGVFRAGHWVLDSFETSLKQFTSNIEIKMPAFPQVVGALLLAHQQTDAAIDESFLANLHQTLPSSLQNKSAAPNCDDLLG
jgi:N-acetylglucosamine kinase-like BadF-type ATPase